MNKDIPKRSNLFKIKLRNNKTIAELIFIQCLKKHKIKHVFQKQYFNESLSVIVDFLIKSNDIRVVVEIDGKYHNNPDQIRKDNYRTKWLKENRRCHVIRFTNEEVIEDVEKCILKLAEYFVEICYSPSNNLKIFYDLLGKEYDLHSKKYKIVLVDTTPPGFEYF